MLMVDKLCLCIIEEGYKKRNVENIEEIEKRKEKRNMKKCRKNLTVKAIRSIISWHDKRRNSIHQSPGVY